MWFFSLHCNENQEFFFLQNMICFFTLQQNHSLKLWQTFASPKLWCYSWWRDYCSTWNCCYVVSQKKFFPPKSIRRLYLLWKYLLLAHCPQFRKKWEIYTSQLRAKMQASDLFAQCETMHLLPRNKWDYILWQVRLFLRKSGLSFASQFVLFFFWLQKKIFILNLRFCVEKEPSAESFQ